MVGVIILNFNNYHDTLNCISSLIHTNKENYKILIVDNGSTNTTYLEKLQSYVVNHGGDILYERSYSAHKLSKLTLYLSVNNDGYARGNNKGLFLFNQDTDIDRILFLNNDIIFYEDVIGHLERFMDCNQDIGIVSPVLWKKDRTEIDYNCARLNYSVFEIGTIYLLMYKNIFGIIDMIKKRKQILRSSPLLLSNNAIKIQLPSGSCMLINKSVINRIGGFDPGTFLYFEENILYKKLNRYNLKNYILPKVGCIHLGATSTKKSRSSFINNCGINSALYYVKEYSDAKKFERYWFFVGYFMMKIKISIVKAFEKI